jgi:hypothetical protein
MEAMLILAGAFLAPGLLGTAALLFVWWRVMRPRRCARAFGDRRPGRAMFRGRWQHDARGWRLIDPSCEEPVWVVGELELPARAVDQDGVAFGHLRQIATMSAEGPLRGTERSTTQLYVSQPRGAVIGDFSELERWARRRLITWALILVAGLACTAMFSILIYVV